jgi:DNA polymerase-3 subunit epsilon
MISKSAFETIIRRGNFVVLDTETTGLSKPAEIVSIAILNGDGEIQLDTLVKPALPIPPDATRIHGITNEDVANAPSWTVVQPLVAHLITGKSVIVYNAMYDRSMMHLSDEAAGLPRTDYRLLADWACAMEWYAEIYGSWNDYHNSYRWQSLSNAMRQQGLPVIDAHRALGDVQMTLSLIRKLIS